MSPARETPAGEPCPHCRGTGRVPTDAERVHEVAEDLRAKGATVTDAEVELRLDVAALALGG